MLTVGLVLFGAGACERVGSYDGVEEPAGAACDSEKEPDLPTQTPTAPPVPNIHLPADAVLVLATRCVFDLESVPGDGQWVRRIEQRADGGLDALATALRLPDEQTPKGVGCALIGYVPTIITVTDTTGWMFVAKLPTDFCGAPLNETVQAVKALPWQTVGTTRVRRFSSGPGTASDCEAAYKPVVALRAAEPGPATEPFKIDATVAPLRICVFTPDRADPIEAGSATLHIGKLAKASTLDGQSAAALLSTLAAAPPVTETCTDEAPFATITGKGLPELEVELGGCYRALDGDSLRQLDAATVQSWHLL